jgi:hypothetical protein
VSRPDATRFVRSPWLAVAAGLAVVVAAVSKAPGATAAAVLVLSAACWLVWRYGWRTGLWLLFLASIPFREPLSIDIVGTASLFPTDLLLVGLFADAAWRGEVRRLWRTSPVLKIGLAILLLSLPGLLTATHLFWGITSVYRIALQVALFVVASSVVRSGRDAVMALVAVVVGLAPSIAYGLYQASLPFGADLPDWANHMVTYGPTGERAVRTFSTFDHPLRFSHYLTIGFGLTVGLAFSKLSRAARAALLVVGALSAYCNMFTASIAGAIGTLSVAVTGLVLGRRRAVVLLPLLVVALFFLSPGTLVRKASSVLGGDATTVAARLITYQQGLTVVRDHPLTGVGWGGIRRSLEFDYRITRAHAVAFGAENYFLQRAVALGLPGLALYVALFVIFFRNLGRTRGSPAAAVWPGAALLVGGIAFCVQAQSIPATTATTNFVLWLLFATAERMAEAVSGPRDVTGAAIPPRASGDAGALGGGK